MKTFIVTFLFVAATILPILFLPLLVVTLIVGIILAPHIHDVWSEPKRTNDHHFA